MQVQLAVVVELLTLYAEHPHVKVSPAKPAPHAINWYKEFYWAAVAESIEKGHGWGRGTLAKTASRWAEEGKRLKRGPQGINVVDIEVAFEVLLMDNKSCTSTQGRSSSSRSSR